MEDIIHQYGALSLLAVAVIALVTSAIHGATGVAGGFLLTAALAPIVGVTPIVPLVSVSLLISHASRILLNWRDFNRSAFLSISMTAVPCIIIMASLYGRMSSSLIALVLGSVILFSIPVRRWAASRQIKTSRKTLSGVGAVYGSLSGVSIGPGMLLVPFMLGYGLRKEEFVATLAAIALLSNITRVTVFGTTDLLTSQYVLMGLLCGVMTIPGNWIGRTMLRRMTSKRHSWLVDVLTVIGALNFFWLSAQ